jgi:hypothetical protein
VAQIVISSTERGVFHLQGDDLLVVDADAFVTFNAPANEDAEPETLERDHGSYGYRQQFHYG